MTHEEDNEDKIILKAIMDVNLPKFSSSDSKLFQVDFHMIDTESHFSTNQLLETIAWWWYKNRSEALLPLSFGEFQPPFGSHDII